MRPGADEAAALLRRFGSPLYVYDAAEVERAYRAFIAAFPYHRTESHYAAVCNKNPHLLRRLRELGAGVHANTPGDAFAALEAGFPPERIVYSGTNLTRADLLYLLEYGIRMNLDSLDQLRDYACLAPGTPVGLRLLVEDPSGPPTRIGVTPDELPEAMCIARPHGVRLVGLHMYAGTNTLRVDRFLACLERLISASHALDELEYLNAGGGFGVAYAPHDRELDLPALGRAMADRMRALSSARGHPVTLVLEPGRMLVSRSGTLLVSVVSVKSRGGRRFVGVDSTVGNIVVPSVYHRHHRIEALSARTAPLAMPTDVCGNTTHSRDYLGRNVRLPHVEPGDILALRDVGAYGYAMSSHFLNRPRPAEVVLDGETAVLTTRRESLSDLTAAYGARP